MRVLVVSANMGRTVSNTVVKQKDFDVDFICYNDTNLPLRKSSFTPRMNAKIPKMLAWLINPGYDYYIWMDSYFNMNRDDSVAWFMKNIKGHDALFFQHKQRNTIVSEAKFMKDEYDKGNSYIQSRINGEPVCEQADNYVKSGFVDNTLIVASSFCYSAELVKNKEYNVMKEWYFQTCFWSIRDQVSLPYVLQLFNINYKLSEENVFGLKYLK